jgi:chloride channel protein, CIC family
LPIHWMWCPALGGLIIGLGGLIEPRVLGVGYDIIDGLLNSKMLPQAVLTILLVKAAIWLVALSSGTSGGVLAPLLIFGGALGWLVGLVLPGDPGFWALLGMAAMMGGTMRAPLTGTFFAVELTGDVSALLPLLAATVSAYAVTVLLLRRSILTEKIARRGQHITREYGIDPFELTRAADIMIRSVDVLAASMPVEEALGTLAERPQAHRYYPVVEEGGRLVGMVSRADALRWQQQPDIAGQTLYDLISDYSIPTAYPDDTIGRIADMMIEADAGRIPIVEKETGILVGLIARKDLLHLRNAGNRSEFERNAYFRA